jgi:hypothetical protein
MPPPVVFKFSKSIGEYFASANSRAQQKLDGQQYKEERINNNGFIRQAFFH